MNSIYKPTSMSYTNKDFNSIYVELLDYAKKISSNWDPSGSTESDPGVVLLKLAALIGDKNNYNIDKNILELMPASVTNIAAARQLLDQCGYSMKHYRAATGIVHLTLFSDIDRSEDDMTEYTYVLPMFSMFTDVDKTVVYSTIELGNLTVSETCPINVMEGIATSYTVNNDPLITLSNLDNKNRLYFTEMNIAENGIFITNYRTGKSPAYEEWKKVDNLETQPAGSKCYKFGVTTDGAVCYIEFPEDIDLLFGEGLNITYIQTTGTRGNVATNKLRDFYVDTKAIKKANTNLSEYEVSITTEHVNIKNPMEIVNGSDPESIAEAYRSYRRVKDTFNTLVSLKDYSDYMVTSQSASNGYVCDRTNDICDSYKLLQGSDLGGALKTIIDTAPSSEHYVKIDDTYLPAMEDNLTAFDLRVYSLNYQSEVATRAQFENTFMLSDGNTYIDLLRNDDVVKSLQHDFKEFPTEKILMLKNKYSILAHIIPRYKLSLNEQHSVAENVRKALYNAVNSKLLSFGEQVSYDTIIETIESADERIKASSVAYPTYQTFAVYKDKQGNFKELRIDDKSYGGFIEEDTYDENKSYYKIINNVMTLQTSLTKLDDSITYYIFDESLNDLWNKFRAEIYAKNVLAGVTPLYTFDTSFARGVNQTNIEIIEGVKTITTNTIIEPSKERDTYTYSVDSNENILLTAPSYIEENNYSSYVKMLYSIKKVEGESNNILAKTKYQLRDDTDFIVFFWKPSDNEVYNYCKYSENSIANMIEPSFNMPKEQGTSSSVLNLFRKELPDGLGKLDDVVTYAELGYKTMNKYIVDNLKHSEKYEILTGSQIIKTYQTNKIHINADSSKGSKYIYWILNNEDNMLFSETSDVKTQEYILQSGEYFFYTNDSKTLLNICGEGTKISRTIYTRSPSEKFTLQQWTRKKVPYDEILINGIDALADKWQIISQCNLDETSTTFTAVFAQEMQHQLIGPGSSLKITTKDERLPIDASAEFYILKPSGTRAFEGSLYYLDQKLSNDCIKLSYVDDEGHDTDIPLTDATEGWSIRSILNLDLNSSKPQKLTENQSFKFLTDANNEYLLYNESILSNIDIHAVGGIRVSVQPDTKTKVKLLSYSEVDSSDDNITYQHSSFTAKIDLKLDKVDNDEYSSDPYVYSFKDVVVPEFSIPSGNYLFRITGDKELMTLDVITDNKDIKFSKLLSDSSVSKIYMLSSNTNSSDTKVHLKVSGSTIYPDQSLIIHPLYKYTTEELDALDNPLVYPKKTSENTFEKLVLDKLSNLDKSREVDYTYNPISAIKSPLDSNMFLNKSHVYNSFTICEWVESNSDGSDIDVTSNVN